jgi:hypothetical protein
MEDRPRPSRIRIGSVFVRAAHLLAAGVVAGGILLGVVGGVPHIWWILAGASGVLMMVVEFIQHRELHREIAGWSTLLKLLLIGGIFAVPAAAAPSLMASAFLVAVVGAHAPRSWRHRRVI